MTKNRTYNNEKYGLWVHYINKRTSLLERSKAYLSNDFDKLNTHRKELLEQEKAQEKTYKKLKKQWADYIENAWNENTEDHIDKYNNLLIEIESQLPFKDRAEHDLWLDLGDTYMGDDKWLDLTKKIISRLHHNYYIVAMIFEIGKQTRIRTNEPRKCGTYENEKITIVYRWGNNGKRYERTHFRKS